MSFFNDKVIVITGGSDGIGRALIDALIPLGAKIATCARNYDKLYNLQLEYPNILLHTMACDVSNENDCKRFIVSTIEVFGHIDILVNNAGIQNDAPIDKMTLEQWDAVIGTNLTGQFLCAREAIREFKRRGVVEAVSASAGKIIFMSSVHEVIPWGGRVNYAASKGGIMLLMKSIAQEVASLKIRANSICPGAIRTPLNRSAWEEREAYHELMTLIPYRRIGEPNEIGRLAVFLASDYADYIMGASIFVDGGMTLYPGFETGG